MVEQYMFEDPEEDRQRLEAQAQYFNPATERFLRASGVGPGMRVLDLGSGAGDVALLAARLVGPEGSVAGVEREPASIAGARKRAAAAGAGNVEFVEGDAQTLEGIDGGYDAVIGRLIMMYLPDPVAALRNAADRLRPGGVLAVQEPDLAYDWAYPQTPLYEQVRRWFLETLDRAGIEPRMGLRLYQCFLEAGLPVPELSLEAAVISGQHSARGGWADVVSGVVPLMERVGVTTAADVDPGTLADRLKAEVVAVSGIGIGPPMIGAAARTGTLAQPRA